MGLLDFFLGNKDEKLADFVSRDAVILDVRSTGEYQGGAIPGSKNIPLQSISSKLSEIKKWNKPVITCCASGMRSSSAASILKANGIEVMNGGGYMNLFHKLS